MNDHTTLAPVQAATYQAVDKLIAIVLDGVSPRTARNYEVALTDFVTWHMNAGQAGFSKATVQAHIAYLKHEKRFYDREGKVKKIGVADSSINQRLSAIKKLAQELADNGVIDESTFQSIRRIDAIKRHGKRMGNWLSEDDAKQMIAAADVDTLLGKRDQAIMAVMLGCGLRREETTNLTVEHLQQRDGRWVILDLEGKHNRVRTVPMASWVKATIDKWTAAAGIDAGYLFPPMRKGDRIQPGNMSAQAIWKVVQRYSPVDNLAPHDLRRTFAKLAHKHGTPIEQIQFSLGHASVQTTEAYIGADLDLKNSPSDAIPALV